MTADVFHGFAPSQSTKEPSEHIYVNTNYFN